MTTSNRPAFAILIGGGTAAVLDIVYAFIRNGIGGRDPLWVLQFVASGLTGKDSFNMGVTGGAIGMLSHFVILFIAAALYLAVSKRVSLLRTQWLLCGVIFGILVYLFMNFVVIPFSAVPFRMSYDTPKLLEGFLSHGVLVGLPIAYAVKKRA